MMKHRSIFDFSHPGRTGVSLPALDVPETEVDIDRKLLREGETGLPQLSENQVLRHFVRLSRKNYNVEEGIYPLGCS